MIDVSLYALSSFSQNSTKPPATHYSNPRNKAKDRTYRTTRDCKQSHTDTHTKVRAEYQNAVGAIVDNRKQCPVNATAPFLYAG